VGASFSGGLRYAATTGYYLKALQAEIRSLRFTNHPQPAEAGGSPESPRLSPTPRAVEICGTLTWGSAALHPRLYAAARSTG